MKIGIRYIFLSSLIYIGVSACGPSRADLNATATLLAGTATVQAHISTVQASSATAQARTNGTQVFNATAQAGTATPQAQIATAQVATSTPLAETAIAQEATAISQKLINTAQAETVRAQLETATRQAETATEQVEIATKQAAIATGLQEASTAFPATANALSGTATAQANIATMQAITATAQALEQVRRVIRAIDPFPTNKPDETVTLISSPTEQEDYDLGYIVNCAPKTYSVAGNLEEITALNINAADLWPGAVIQGKSISLGALASIPFERASGTITVLGLPGQRSKLVENPSLASVNAAIEELLPDSATPPLADMTFETQQVYSFQHLMLGAGFVTGVGPHDLGLGPGFSIGTDQSHVLVKFRQRYYTVVFTRTSSDPAGVFRAVKLNQLGDYMSTGNAPMYISSVDYGRELIMVVSSYSSGPELEAAVNYMYKGKVGGYLEGSLAKVLQDAKIQLVAHGGSAEDVLQIIEADFDNADSKKTMNDYLARYFVSGANVSRSSRGAPLSFRANYMRDDTAAAASYSVSYTSSDCDRVRPLPPSNFVLTLDRIKINHVDGGWIFRDKMDISLSFGVYKQDDLPVKQVYYGAPITVQSGSVLSFGDHSPIFSMASQNDTCFDIYVAFGRRFLLSNVELGEDHDPICYNNGDWSPGTGPRSMHFAGGGLDADVFYTIEKH